ncbi:MAG: LptF/LptG family permease [Bacteroidetes bacterium]|nr:LptF/LptG family permease [Bacteroidota bacterium]
MLTRFNRMVLRMLPGPFFGWLAALMFLLVLQFLIKHMPDLVGKGLPLQVILELMTYSLAYMVVLAVPMSVLIATLIVFGRLAENRSFAVIKSSGVSIFQLAWPAAIVGFLLAGVMAYFNTEVLPEANFRAKVLWSDIRQKKPGFVLQPGVFYDGIKQYSILVQDLDPVSNEMHDVTIFDYTGGARERSEIKAERGQIVPLDGGEEIRLVLYNGELHKLEPAEESRAERYERVRFSEHRLTVSLDDFAFERSDLSRGRRSDRTMRIGAMVAFVDSLRSSVERQKALLAGAATGLGKEATDQIFADQGSVLPGPGDGSATLPANRVALAGLNGEDARTVYYRATQAARLERTNIDNTSRTIVWQEQQADRYSVEIHKKYSIAVACLIFLLVAAPLGLSVRKSSLAMTGAIAMGIFLFYWVSLVYGEKLADRGKLEPWIGMWIANAIALVSAIYLGLYVVLDLRATPSLWKRLKYRLRSQDVES